MYLTWKENVYLYTSKNIVHCHIVVLGMVMFTVVPLCQYVLTQKTPPSPHIGIMIMNKGLFPWSSQWKTQLYVHGSFLSPGRSTTSLLKYSCVFDHFSTSPPSLAPAIVLGVSSSSPHLPPQLLSGIMFARYIDFWDADAVYR